MLLKKEVIYNEKPPKWGLSYLLKVERIPEFLLQFESLFTVASFVIRNVNP